MTTSDLNRPEADSVRHFLLIQELVFAFRLIRYGAVSFREVKHPTQDAAVEVFLLASGLERLLKVCTLAVVCDLDGSFPNRSPWPRGNSGHNLVVLFDLLDSIIREAGSDGPKTKISTSLFMDILSEFGDFAETGRYHNLNLVLGQSEWGDDPQFSMAKLKLKILSADPAWEDRTSESMKDLYDRMTIKIVTGILDGISTILGILENDIADVRSKHVANVGKGRVEDLREELGILDPA